MTEKEKMGRQMLYDANYDSELQQERIACKELCYDYNALRPSQRAEQTALLQKLLGTGIFRPMWWRREIPAGSFAPSRRRTGIPILTVLAEPLAKLSVSMIQFSIIL